MVYFFDKLVRGEHLNLQPENLASRIVELPSCKVFEIHVF